MIWKRRKEDDGVKIGKIVYRLHWIATTVQTIFLDTGALSKIVKQSIAL